MKRIIAFAVALAFISMVVYAEPPTITKAGIERAANATAARTTEQDRTPDPQVRTSTNSTLIVVLLAVLVVGAGVYLISANSNKHGGNGIFAKRSTQKQPITYRSRFLRSQYSK